MAMNYKIIQDSNGYNIVESPTDQVVKTFDSHSDAKKMMKHLNLGGGFDGFTPNFFLKSVKSLYQNTK